MTNFDDSWRRTHKTKVAVLEWHRRQARRDPNAWAEFAFRDAAGQPLRQGAIHRQLQEFLRECRHALIELPRDHGKTMQMLMRVLWELGHRPWLRIKIVCATEALAVERGRFVRDSIATNARVRLVFPQLRPSQPWTPERFTVHRPAEVVGPSVTALGIDNAATGTRADLLICDDIVDVHSLSSRTQRERVKSHFRDNLMNLVEPHGRVWCLFTPWHRDDLNAELKANPAFALFRRPIGPDFEPIWPEKWSQEKLRQRCQEIGESSFARGYRLQCLSDDDVLIPSEAIRFWHDPCPPADLTVLAIDPAVSERQSADASAWVVLVRDAEGLIRCVEAQAIRVRFPQLIERLIAVERRWKPDLILLEANAAFAGLADLFIARTPFGGKVQPVKQSTDKFTRFRIFSTAVHHGTFRLRGEGTNVDPGQKALWEEMTLFPHGDHDDLLDAAAMGTAWLLSAGRSPSIRF
jgi:predicted phage terminase large subunit-like protein